ncbi:MAG TPA: hypothetical protein VJ937_14985 [Salinivirga sp.]|uniref:hypothetical protein n=1 Tax=Salinivirga sp. TaxID=1970192 RepID=UPI002B47F389|nr:hypothetical protein [Salinivirga sp.]HKK60784.1 hypothetical protein [Salinivirga sp.]
MWRKLSILIVLAGIALSAWGQSKSNSPYSVFGLGDIYTPGSIQFPEYGGASSGLLEKNKINFSNPAAYRAIDSMRFLIDFALTSATRQIADENDSHITHDFNFTYYAVGFRVTPWWHASIGLTPVSNRNYRIGINSSMNGISSETYYVGRGNLNQAYLGQSFSITPNLSVGFNVKYLFGELTEAKTILFPQTFRNTQEGYTKQIHDFGFDAGIMYTHSLPNDKRLNVGFTYTPLQAIDYTEDYLFGAGDVYNVEDINDNIILDTTAYYEDRERSFNLPQSFSFGASYVVPREKTATVAFDMSLWDDAENNNLENNATTLSNSYRISSGYSFIPKWNAASSYFKRMTYVFGAFFEKQYMDVQGENINNMAISAGVGLPIRRAGMTLNIGAEVGQRGMVKNDLIQENYIKLNIKLNFREVWFFERKYD